MKYIASKHLVEQAIARTRREIRCPVATWTAGTRLTQHTAKHVSAGSIVAKATANLKILERVREELDRG